MVALAGIAGTVLKKNEPGSSETRLGYFQWVIKP
jgi:hypothetical protein